MKIPLRFQPLVISMLAGGIGYWLGSYRNPSPDPPADEGVAKYSLTPGTHGKDSSPMSGTAEGLLSPALRRLLGGGEFSDSSIRDITARVLDEADPGRRAAAIGLILESMSPSNASAIRLAFIDSTTRTGRTHDAEWFLMIRKFGQTLGQAALDEIKTNDSQAATALEGWAMSDPDAALAYLRAKDPHGEGYAQKWRALLCGVALKDPAKSFQLALAEPDGPLDAQALLQAAVQSVGLTSATEVMQQALDGAGPDVAQNSAFLQMFHSLTESMFHKNWISGESEKMLPWLEEQKGQPFLNDNLVSHAAMDTTLQGKVTEALDWLDRMNEGNVGGDSGNEGLRSALMRDPSLLAKVDEATLNRIIARFPPRSTALTSLAEALEASNPDYAGKLRAAGP